MKLKTTVLTAFLLILTPPFVNRATGQSNPEPPSRELCKEASSPPSSDWTCKVETFEQVSTGNKGKFLSTASGLSFETIDNNDLFIQDISDLGHALSPECFDNYMELPNRNFKTDFVRFRFSGAAPWDVTFVAESASGSLVDSVRVENDSSDPPQIVRLRTRNKTIQRVWILHYDLDDRVCKKVCTEPYIGSVRFCDRR